MHLSFINAMKTGHEDIDREHEHIIDAFNATVDGVTASTDVVQARGYLQAFLDLCADHFRHEESILAQAGYPHLNDHMAYHKAMLDTARDAGERFTLAQDDASRKSHIDDMMGALIDDIVKIDMMFVSYLQTRGLARALT